jgi:hypothetical protein
MHENATYTSRCRRCGTPVRQLAEKALSGEVQWVWASEDGGWVCPVDSNEHAPDVVRARYCDEQTDRGSVCDRRLDDHGQCPRADRHDSTGTTAAAR